MKHQHIESVLEPIMGSRKPPLKSSLKLMTSRRDLFRARLVFYLFLASLAVFFVAGLVSYLVIRTQSFQPIEQEYLALKIPLSFWISTIMLVLVSGFLHGAVWMVRRERQVEFRRWLILAWSSAVAFLAIQYAGMNQLWEVHFTRFDGSSKIYGLCFTLTLLHALHVLGGLVFLAFVIWQGFRYRYDHERHFAVEHCASYWHFLDIVWVVMLMTFVITG